MSDVDGVKKALRDEHGMSGSTKMKGSAHLGDVHHTMEKHGFKQGAKHDIATTYHKGAHRAHVYHSPKGNVSAIHFDKGPKLLASTEVARKGKRSKKAGGRSKFLSALMRQISTDHGADLVKAFDSKDKDGFKTAFNTLGSKLRRSMSVMRAETAAVELSETDVLTATSQAIVEAADLAEAQLDWHGLSVGDATRQKIEDAIIRILADAETESLAAQPEAAPQDAVEHFTYEDDRAARLHPKGEAGKEEATAEVVLTQGTAFSLRPDGNRYTLTAGTQTLAISAQTADALRMRGVESEG